MAPISPNTILDQLAVEQTGPETFTSKCLPQRLGHAAPIAYGGCTASIAVHSACKTVGPNFHIYSVLGAFHGPTKIDRQINCTVTPTRNTKTFATRRVVASQTQEDGSERTCLDCFVDFQVAEESLFEYSAPPHGQYSFDPLDPKRTKTTFEVLEDLAKYGEITPEQAQAYKPAFAIYESYIENRQCIDGVSGQNLIAFANHIHTTQDHLNITDKTSAEWVRTRTPLRNTYENIAALAFIMDGAISFLPLNHDHKNFEDAGACSTLDFALRVMLPDFNMAGWHLRERRVVAAGKGTGRTYGESRLWDRDGRLVAVENQSCICRPLPRSKGDMKARM